MLKIEFLMELIGWIGAVFFLVAYYLLITKKWTSDQKVYHVFNILGGLLLSINTVYFQVWAAAAINAIWGFIAVYGLLKSEKK